MGKHGTFASASEEIGAINMQSAPNQSRRLGDCKPSTCGGDNPFSLEVWSLEFGFYYSADFVLP